jgi:hypothetical protein
VDGTELRFNKAVIARELARVGVEVDTYQVPNAKAIRH